jgi:hypothetical protein
MTSFLAIASAHAPGVQHDRATRSTRTTRSTRSTRTTRVLRAIRATHATCAVLALLTLPVSGWGQILDPGAIQAIAPGRTVQGALSQSSSVLPVSQRSFALFRLDGVEAGGRYRATLRGEGFEAAVSLVYASGGLTEVARDGQFIWEDVSPFSELRFRLDRPGLSLLMVSGWDLPSPWTSEFGPLPFTLSLEALPPSPLPVVRDLPMGVSMAGQLSDASAVWESEWAGEVPYDLWRFEGREGDLIRISMRAAELDSYLEVGSWDGETFSVEFEDDDSGGDRDAQIRFMLPRDGAYWVRARAFSGWIGNGFYTLLVEADEPLEIVRRPIVPGTPVASEFTDADGEIPGTGIAVQEWVFQGVAGTRYEIRMQSDMLDSYLSLGVDGPDGIFRELDWNDDAEGDGLNSRIEHVAGETRTYVIRARTFGPGTFGPYTLSVRVIP